MPIPTSRGGRLEIVPDVLTGRRGFGHDLHLLLARSPLGDERSHSHRRLMGHAVEPVADGLFVGEGRRFLDEDEKGCLKCVSASWWLPSMRLHTPHTIGP